MPTSQYAYFPVEGGSSGSGIASINGDTTSAQHIVGGSGISVATVSGTTTITNTLVPTTEPANYVYAGPASGAAATPTFRPLVSADIPDLSSTYILTSLRGASFGVASLDGSGKIPVGQLPSVVMTYQGVWNPSTNTPTLSDGTGTNGDVYWVSTAFAGPVSGLSNASMVNFQVGDLVLYSSALSQWELTTPAAGVSSVNGAQGAVTVNAINQLTGDVTTTAASGSQSKASTLATVNSSPGTYTYATLTVNGKGLVTAASSGSAPTGTVTSVGLADSTGLFNITNTPVTSSGTLTMATPVFTGIPYSNGTTFAAAVAGNFPTLNQNTTGTAANATNVATTQTSTNATMYPTFVASNSTSNQGIEMGTGLTFNPSTNILTTTQYVSGAGSTSAPSFTFTGSLTTGIYASATNQLGFLANGTNYWNISSTGMFGAPAGTSSTIQNTTNSAGSGGSLTIAAGASSNNGSGGGNLILDAGVTSSTTTGNGGNITVNAGSASGTGSTGNGGNITLTAGSTVGGTAGSVSFVTAGATRWTINNSGTLGYLAGSSASIVANSNGSGNGGALSITSGGTSNNGSNAGALTLNGGSNSSTTSGVGGTVTITGGSATGAGSIGNGGGITLNTGGTVGGSAGAITFQIATAAAGTIQSSGAWVIGGPGTTLQHTLNTSTATVGTGVGTFTNLPAGFSGNPTGYIQITINGGTHVIPYW